MAEGKKKSPTKAELEKEVQDLKKEVEELKKRPPQVRRHHHHHHGGGLGRDVQIKYGMPPR